MIFIATLGGLGALVGWGLSDYFAGKSGQQSSTLLTNLVLQSVGLIVLLPIIIWKGLPLELNTALLLIIASAAFLTIAHISFIKAMSLGPFGVAAPLGNAYPLITLFIAVAFLHLQISPLQFLALLTIIGGVIMLVVDRTTLNYRKLRGSTVAFALVTMISWGLAFSFIDIIVTDFAWYQLVFMLGVFMVSFSFLLYIITHKTFPNWNTLKYSNIPQAWQAGLLVTVGSISFFSASAHSGSVIIPAVIASASPLVTSFLAYVRDKEQLPLYKRIGAIIIILGLVLLNIL